MSNKTHSGHQRRAYVSYLGILKALTLAPLFMVIAVSDVLGQSNDNTAAAQQTTEAAAKSERPRFKATRMFGIDADSVRKTAAKISTEGYNVILYNGHNKDIANTFYKNIKTAVDEGADPIFMIFADPTSANGTDTFISFHKGEQLEGIWDPSAGPAKMAQATAWGLSGKSHNEDIRLAAGTQPDL